MHYTVHNRCRACGSSTLEPVLDLGSQPFANDHRRELGINIAAPLSVLWCDDCKLGQLSVVVKPDVLYSQYTYTTSRSITMFKHLVDLWRDLCKCLNRTPRSVLEVGSNDGFALKTLASFGAKRIVGIDPAANLLEAAKLNGVEAFTDLFSTKCVRDHNLDSYKFDVVLLRHVFCHIDNWRDTLAAVKACLADDGIAMIEAPHVCQLLKNGEWDTIYHEHLSYLSVTAIRSIAAEVGLGIGYVYTYSIHGGSIGIVLRKKKNNAPDPNGVEDESELNTGTWGKLRESVDASCQRLVRRLEKLNSNKKRVVGFGAPAKATVVCNRAGIHSSLIPYTFDNTPWKQGCFIPGTDVLIKAPEPLENVADAAVIFPWNYWWEIATNNSEFSSRGGQMIHPLKCP